MSSLRIVLGLESSGPGGAETVVLRLADALRARGDEPIVASLRPGWMTERSLAAGIETWIVPQRRGLDPGWIPAFARRLRRERIDVLHAHEFVMNVYGGAAARLARIPCVATIHGRNWATGHPRRALAYRVLRRFGVRVVAVSHDLARFLESGFGLPAGALDVVHNGIPIPVDVDLTTRAARRAEARALLGLPASSPLVVAVGNLYAVKGHTRLIDALSCVPEMHVTIAGRGEEETRLRAQAAEAGVAARLHLLGLRDDVDRVLDAADVFAQPSLSEGLPLAVLEAMAHGLPVVATNVGGMPEAICDGETGVLLPPSDSPALVAALARLLGDASLRERIGTAARARAIAAFSIDAMVGGYRALWEPRARRG